MALSLYLSASLLVFLLSAGPFLRDPSNPKTCLGSWLFLALAMILSPVTLPNMVYKRLPNRSSYQVRVAQSLFPTGQTVGANGIRQIESGVTKQDLGSEAEISLFARES